MKRGILVALLLAAVLTLTACGTPKDAAPAPTATAELPAQTEAPAPQATQVPDTGDQIPPEEALAQIIAAGDAATPNPFDKPVYDGPPSAMRPEATHYRDIGPLDIGPVIHWDLSRMSATMAYAQLYTMLTEPEKFVGQTVKVRGQYYPSADENGVPLYHFVIVFDAAACCELGIEFLWTGNPPANMYPPPMSIVEMTGLFDICNDGGEKFCVLRVDEFEVLQEAQPPSVTAMP